MNNLNMEVRVHLRDDASRQASKLLGTLDRFGVGAARLTNHASKLTGSLNRLTSAFRGLNAVSRTAENAEVSTARLRGTIAGIGKEAKAASSGIGSMSRATARLATNAGKAADGVGRLKSALSGTVADGGFVGQINAQLRETLDLQRRARAGMRALGGGDGRGGRRGLMGGGGERVPGVALALHPHGGAALRSVYEQATSLQDAIVKMHLNGLSDSEIAAVRAKADEVAKFNKSTTPLSNINAIMEARLALGGDLHEALSTAGEMSKLRTIVGFSLGKDRAKSAEDGVYDMLRTGEIRGLISDPARRNKLFQGMTAALIASNGRITPKQWHQTAIYGRSATQGLSDEFMNGRLPFLMQELQGGARGGQAGTALQALFRAIPMAITKQSNIREWRKLGFIDESKIIRGSQGGEKALPGAITLGKTAISDPDQAVFKLLDSMKAHGITERDAIIQKFAQLVGTGTGQTAVDILGLQRDRLDNFTRTLKQVEDADTLFAQINQTASQSVANLDASMKALSGNIGSIVIPSFTGMVDAANRFVGVVNRAAETGGKNGNDPVSRQGGGANLTQLALLGGGGAWGLAKLAQRFPLFGRFMAGSAGAVVTGSPFGAAMEPVITSGAKLFASKLPEAIKIGIGGLGKGLFLGLMTEAGKGAIDALNSKIQSRLFSPERIYRSKKFNEQWFFQKWGFGGGSSNPMDPRFAPPEGTPLDPTLDSRRPIAGKRAFGGPVSRGLSYLVGERGPEIFTPGVNGSIGTNDMLRRAGSDAGLQALASVLASAIRFQTFALATALRDIVGRSRWAGAVGNGLSGAGVGGSSGSAGGGGGSGGGAGGGDGSTPQDNSPMGRAGLSGDMFVASAQRAFGLGGWRSLANGGRQRFMAGTKAGKLGIGTIDVNAFQPMGVSGATNARLAASRTNLVGELDRNPGLRRDVFKTISMENRGSPLKMQAVLESMVNRAQMNRYRSLSQAVHSGFYGPVNRGGLRGALSEKDRRDGEAALARVRAGSNMIGYRTDQGMLTDPGARRYMAEGGDHSGWAKFGGENFFYMGRAGRKWALQQQAEDRVAANKPLETKIGAFGLGGFNSPGGETFKSPAPSAQVPSVLAERARYLHEERRRREKSAPAKTGPSHGPITMHIHPGPGHDEKQLASAVHRRFNESVASQLNDGAYA